MSRFFIPSNLYRAVMLTTALTISACDSNNNTVDDAEPLEIGAANGTDFIALRVEAENFTSLTGGWTLTNHNNIPKISPDPDPPHHQSASGSANMELLPDTRVTHNDVITGGINFWSNPGKGPRMEYDLNIPEAGRYIVYVRAYSTGAEDNGIHVGFDNSTPTSGMRIQLCSGKNKWTWSSAQRVTTNHCGVPKTIFLDFPSAGNHTVKFYAREDGYELDQFLLLKETNSDLDCAPVGDDELKCTDINTGKNAGKYKIPAYSSSGGNIVIPPPPPPVIDIDLDIDIAASGSTFMVGEVVTFTIEIDNDDNNDNATDVSAKIALPNELAFASSASCTQQGNNIVCDFSEIAPDESVTASFTATVQQTGTPRLDAEVEADQSDKKLGNNSASVSIETTPYIPALDGTLSAAQTPNIMGLADNAMQIMLLHNAGRQTISGATISFETDALLSIDTANSPNLGDCSGSPVTTCTLSDLAAAADLEVPVTLNAQGSGLATLQISFDVPGDEDQSNNSTALTVLVADAPVYSMAQGDLALEAEEFHTQSVLATSSSVDLHGWSVTAPEIRSTITPDFDQGNFASASAESYVEYLPDSRVGEADPAIEGISNFATGGASAVLSYRAYFDNAGRYFINVRTRASNTEDATVHIGLDDTWAESTGSVSVCQPDGEWQWANGQIVNGICDPALHPFIDVASAGYRTINVSAATDGVEVDKLILRFENPETPEGLGADPAELQMVDLDIAVSSSFSTEKAGSTDAQDGDFENADSLTEEQIDDEQQTYLVRVDNNDPEFTAYDIDVTITGLDTTLVSAISGFEDCAASGDNINCKIYALAASSHAVATVDTMPDSDTEISATVTLGEASDTDPDNNTTVATPVGAGSLSPWWLFAGLFTLIVACRRKDVPQRESLPNNSRFINE